MGPAEEELRSFPIPEEGITLLGEGDGATRSAKPYSHMHGNPWFIETSEQTTTPVTSAALNSWEEFHPLVHSMDRHCDDDQVKSMACLQAIAF